MTRPTGFAQKRRDARYTANGARYLRNRGGRDPNCRTLCARFFDRHGDWHVPAADMVLPMLVDL